MKVDAQTNPREPVSTRVLQELRRRLLGTERPCLKKGSPHELQMLLLDFLCTPQCDVLELLRSLNSYLGSLSVFLVHHEIGKRLPTFVAGSDKEEELRSVVLEALQNADFLRASHIPGSDVLILPPQLPNDINAGFTVKTTLLCPLQANPEKRTCLVSFHQDVPGKSVRKVLRSTAPTILKAVRVATQSHAEKLSFSAQQTFERALNEKGGVPKAIDDIVRMFVQYQGILIWALDLTKGKLTLAYHRGLSKRRLPPLVCDLRKSVFCRLLTEPPRKWVSYSQEEVLDCVDLYRGEAKGGISLLVPQEDTPGGVNWGVTIFVDVWSNTLWGSEHLDKLLLILEDLERTRYDHIHRRALEKLSSLTTAKLSANIEDYLKVAAHAAKDLIECETASFFLSDDDGYWHLGACASDRSTDATSIV